MHPCIRGPSPGRSGGTNGADDPPRAQRAPRGLGLGGPAGGGRPSSRAQPARDPEDGHAWDDARVVPQWNPRGRARSPSPPLGGLGLRTHPPASSARPVSPRYSRSFDARDPRDVRDPRDGYDYDYDYEMYDRGREEYSRYEYGYDYEYPYRGIHRSASGGAGPSRMGYVSAPRTYAPPRQYWSASPRGPMDAYPPLPPTASTATSLLRTRSRTSDGRGSRDFGDGFGFDGPLPSMNGHERGYLHGQGQGQGAGPVHGTSPSRPYWTPHYSPPTVAARSAGWSPRADWQWSETSRLGLPPLAHSPRSSQLPSISQDPSLALPPILMHRSPHQARVSLSPRSSRHSLTSGSPVVPTLPPLSELPIPSEPPMSPTRTLRASPREPLQLIEPVSPQTQRSEQPQHSRSPPHHSRHSHSSPRSQLPLRTRTRRSSQQGYVDPPPVNHINHDPSPSFKPLIPSGGIAGQTSVPQTRSRRTIVPVAPAPLPPVAKEESLPKRPSSPVPPVRAPAASPSRRPAPSSAPSPKASPKPSPSHNRIPAPIIIPSPTPNPSSTVDPPVVSPQPQEHRDSPLPAVSTAPDSSVRAELAPAALPPLPLASSPASSPLTPVGCISDVPSPAPFTPPFTSSARKGRMSKGKGRAEPERRVLPARIRRAAGAGAETVRDMEEMIVDWLERYGDINSNAPASLSIRLTTLPLALVEPKPYVVQPRAKSVPEQRSDKPDVESEGKPEVDVELKAEPQEAEVKPAPPSVPAKGEDDARIETPSWIIIKDGEDDQMEAREEMTIGIRSPNKRLRHSVVGSQPLEDTSDEYYEQAHRKMEAFERRQGIYEIDKLKFMRHKMNARIELLRNLQPAQWTTVVANVLSRTDRNEAWERGRRKLDVVGIDWLRRRIIREGIDLLKRYDQLLPGANDQKKHRLLDPSYTASSPLVSSASPPPTARGTPAPAEDEPRKRGRPRKSTQSEETAKDLPPRKRGRPPRASLQSQGSTSRRQSLQTPPPAPPTSGRPQRAAAMRTRQVSMSSLSDLDVSSEDESPEPPSKPKPQLDVPSPVPTPPLPKLRIRLGGAGATITAIPSVSATPSPAPLVPLAPARDDPAKSTASPTPTPTPTPTPALLQAVKRRQETMAAASPKRTLRITREKPATRSSARLSVGNDVQMGPFGVPLPARLETQAEFSLSGVDDIRPIIAARLSQESAPASNDTLLDSSLGAERASLEAPGVSPGNTLSPMSSLPPGDAGPASARRATGSVGGVSQDTEEEMRDMEGVEASVLNTDGSDST